MTKKSSKKKAKKPRKIKESNAPVSSPDNESVCLRSLISNLTIYLNELKTLTDSIPIGQAQIRASKFPANRSLVEEVETACENIRQTIKRVFGLEEKNLPTGLLQKDEDYSKWENVWTALMGRLETAIPLTLPTVEDQNKSLLTLFGSKQEVASEFASVAASALKYQVETRIHKVPQLLWSQNRSNFDIVFVGDPYFGIHDEVKVELSKKHLEGLKHMYPPVLNSLVQSQRHRWLTSGSLMSEEIRTFPVEDVNEFPNPYISVIDSLPVSDILIQRSKIKYPKSLESTPLLVVNTCEALDKCIEELKKQAIIGVDVEFHAKNSYRGFACLLQISTYGIPLNPHGECQDESLCESRDYIVDVVNNSVCLEIRRLNAVFADPKILKIFHGSDHDIIWLQELFSIFVCNMYDTGQAARILQTPGGRSLKNLMSKYCQIDMDKSMQLSDWRKRPLTIAMLNYARGDTHHLYLIFQRQKEEILTSGMRANGNAATPAAADMPGDVGDTETETETTITTVAVEGVTSYGLRIMENVYEESKKLCQQTASYALPDFCSRAESIILRNSKPVTKLLLRILTALLYWRDFVARVEDVASFVISSEALLMMLAEKKPNSLADLRNIFQTFPRNMYVLARHVHIIQLIRLARDAVPADEADALVAPRTDNSVSEKNVSEKNVSEKSELQPPTKRKRTSP